MQEDYLAIVDDYTAAGEKPPQVNLFPDPPGMPTEPVHVEKPDGEANGPSAAKATDREAEEASENFHVEVRTGEA